MFQSKSNKLLMSSTLALIILCSALAASYVGTVQGTTHFTLWAVLNPSPFWGYYGGYHDIWYRLQPEFAKIGINLVIYFQGDMYDNWYLIWEAPLGGRPGGKPPGHWDMTSMEWWLHPHGFLWMDGIMLSENIPPAGANVEPYLSEENDELYWKTQTSLDPAVRQRYCWAWQEYMMHDPPVINWYYPHAYRFAGSYIQGYDDNVWEQDLSHLRINITDEVRALLPTEVITRLETEKTIIFGADEAWWSYLGIFVDSYTEERYNDLVWGRLYRSTLDPWPPKGVIPAPEDYKIEPYLASDFPTYLTPFKDADGEEVVPVWIPLREGVVWSDGDPFDAQDVKFTYDLVLNPYVLSTGYADFAPVVKRVEYCDASGNNVTDWAAADPYKIRFVLHDAYADLLLILMNDWGGNIIPCHALSGLSPTHLRGSPENKMFAHAKTVPSIGPFMYDDEGTPSGYTYISLARNPNYFGYNTSIVGTPAWGPYDIQNYIFKYVPDAEVRFAEIQIHTIDLGEYPTSPVEVYESPEIMNDPTLLVKKALYPASNDVWMNFNNPYLSNRYVRLALAHATPYDTIFAEILPSWGIVDPIPGRTFVLPWQVYTDPATNETVRLYNTDISPYTFDLAKAQKYLDMWLYSQTGYDTPEEYNKGCVGDADFDGIVDLDDLWYWLDEYGNAPLTREIDWWDTDWSEGEYPWPVGSGCSVAPGNDIDPDFNNDNTVGPEDFTLWFNNWGKEYPWTGAR